MPRDSEEAHEVGPSRPAYDPKEKYLRKLAIVDDKMIDATGHVNIFSNCERLK